MEAAVAQALDAASGPDDERLLAHLERLDASTGAAIGRSSRSTPPASWSQRSRSRRACSAPPSAEPARTGAGRLARAMRRLPAGQAGRRLDGRRRSADTSNAPMPGPSTDTCRPWIPSRSTSPPMKPSWPRGDPRAIDGMARDDDLDYTVLGLLLLERTGGEPTADDVAAEWLARLPAGQIYTAERAAYRNLLLGFVPPAIGLAPQSIPRVDRRTHPRRRVRICVTRRPGAGRRDGRARCLRIARGERRRRRDVGRGHDRPRPGRRAAAESVPEAAEFVPTDRGSTWRCVRSIDLHREGRTGKNRSPSDRGDCATTAGFTRFRNAAIIAAALLWGDGDFERSVTLAVAAGCDTDSNGATVGSAAGALVGAEGACRGVDRAAAATRCEPR